MALKPMGLRSWRDLAAGIEALAEPVRDTESVSAQGAPGRILAATVRAARPLPADAHAVMDGFALGSAPPGRYRILSGRPDRLAIDEAVAVASGEPVPVGAAAVALAGRVQRDGDRLTVPEARRQDNIRRAGEEAAPGDVLIAAGTRLDARHVALAAAAGVTSFTVRRRIEAASLALHEGLEPLPHAVLLSALLASPAVRMPETLSIREAQLAEALSRHAGRRDLVLVVAQSLDGEDAPLARAIRAAGGSVTIGRAAIKPAKPILSGRIGGTIILGFAGTAYAVAVAAHLVLRPCFAASPGCLPTIRCGAPRPISPASANRGVARSCRPASSGTGRSCGWRWPAASGNSPHWRRWTALRWSRRRPGTSGPAIPCFISRWRCPCSELC